MLKAIYIKGLRIEHSMRNTNNISNFINQYTTDVANYKTNSFKSKKDVL